jgi:hypothetical protein
MNSNELLEKVIVSTDIGNPAGSGLLGAEQANQFIDYMWDATVLGGQVRTIRMRSTEQEIDRIGVGKRLIRAAVEAVDTGENQGVFFSKISLTTKKLRLDWELSVESLEDNLEGEALEDHIARLMATQAGMDLEELAINGDTDLTDPTLGIFDGWRKRAIEGTVDGAAHIIDHRGDVFNRAAANAALKAMPREYMQRRNQLKFFLGSNLIQDYLFSLTTDPMAPGYANTAGRVVPEGPAGFTAGTLFGVPYQEVPLFEETFDYVGTPPTGDDAPPAGADYGEVWLTFPQNLLWGIKREIKVVREYAAKKDTIEYTMFCRVGTQVENTKAFVIVRNVRVGA